MISKFNDILKMKINIILLDKCISIPTFKIVRQENVHKKGTYFYYKVLFFLTLDNKGGNEFIKKIIKIIYIDV